MADLLQEIAEMEGTSSEAKISEHGFGYFIEWPGMPSDLPKTISPGYFLIWEEKDGPRPTDNYLDYRAEIAKRDAHRDYQKQLGKGSVNIESSLMTVGQQAPEPPHRELIMATILASMRKGWQSDKQVYKQIIDNNNYTRNVIKSRLQDYRNGLVAVHDSSDPVFGAVSNSQFYNPISGKGIHRPKPNSSAPGSISNDLVDGFIEWLKWRGSYSVMIPYRSGDDFKIYVIEPSMIGLHALRKIRKELRDLNLWGGIRLDIEAILRLADILVRHSDDEDIGLFGKKPGEVLRGLHQALFKSLGTAAALMNYAFLPLPSWFSINNKRDAEIYLGIISEHIGERDGNKFKAGCLSSLDENKPSDIPILQQYRAFITSGLLWDFLEFMSLFAVHVMQRLSKNDWVKQFTTGNLSELLERGWGYMKNVQLREITNNQGFRNVATAIRKATVNAQYRKAAGQQVWDIHYGMAQEWKRKAKFKDDFTNALGDFIQLYNSENARHAEQRKKERRKNVTTDELDEVITLIDSYGPELTCMLLLAYGYAKEPREEDILIDS